MAGPNEEGAIGLAASMYEDIEHYAEEHGASSSVIDGLWALAHVGAALMCSRGVNTERARAAFTRALEHAIATAPPDDGETMH